MATLQITATGEELRPLITEIVTEAIRQIIECQTKSTQSKLLLTVREAAQSLNVSESTVYLLTKSGALRAVRVGTKILYSPEDLQKWISTNKGTTPRKSL